MNEKVNLFVVGAMKAGTTSLSELLSSHEDVYLCPIKEPNFFVSKLPKSIDDSSANFNIKNFIHNLKTDSSKHFAHVTELSDYTDLFKYKQNEKYLVDCSTAYLHALEAPAAIHQYNPDAKIIIILRNPVHRAYSHYKMDFAKGRTNRSFSEEWTRLELSDKSTAWNYYTMSLYTQAIQRYKNLFSNSQILILNLESIKTDKHRFLNDLSSFLEVDFTNMQPSKTNESINPKFPKLNYVLHKTGVKSAISRFLPKSLLENGKSIFYSKSKGQIDDKIYYQISQNFIKDIKATEELIGYKLNYIL